MITLTLLTLLLATYSVYGHNETCRDRGVLGRLEKDTKSSVSAQQSLLESQHSLSESIQSLSEGQQSLTDSLQSVIETLQSLLQAQQAMAGDIDAIKTSNEGGAGTTRGPADCSELYKCGEYLDGVYTIYLGCSQRPVQVYCDMTTDGGGWTVFQRRKDGSVDFYRDWEDYRRGFGNATGELWLGNDNLFLLTSRTRQRMRVELEDFEENRKYAKYDNFKVLSATQKYKLLSIGTYTGNAGNAMQDRALGSMWSTRDQDNDANGGSSCAVEFKGAWWYAACHDSNLNGQYLRGQHDSYADGINWQPWRGHHYSLKFTEMKLRPFDF